MTAGTEYQLNTSDYVLEDFLRCEITEISHEAYEKVEGDDELVACGLLTLRLSVDKNLVPNNFKHIAFFFTLFEGYKCNTLYETTPKKRFLWEPEKTNFKSFQFHETKLTQDAFICVFSIPVKFEIYFP